MGGPSGAGLDELDKLKALAKFLQIEEITYFVDPVPRAELADWYRASDLVCVPSYSESFGLVALEAQACGTPVVATAIGGLRTDCIRWYFWFISRWTRSSRLVSGNLKIDFRATT
jgi:D-inositol-3-phosphate glycosyltransferase